METTVIMNMNDIELRERRQMIISNIKTYIMMAKLTKSKHYLEQATLLLDLIK